MNLENSYEENILLMQIMDEYTTGEVVNIDDISNRFAVNNDLMNKTLYHGKTLDLLMINAWLNEITIINSQYKTKKCNRIDESGGCEWGRHCLFIHTGREEQICKQLCGKVRDQTDEIKLNTELNYHFAMKKTNLYIKNIQDENNILHTDAKNIQDENNNLQEYVMELRYQNDHLQLLNNSLSDRLDKSKKDVKKYRRCMKRKSSKKQSRGRQSSKKSRSE